MHRSEAAGVWDDVKQCHVNAGCECYYTAFHRDTKKFHMRTILRKVSIKLRQSEEKCESKGGRHTCCLE